jgi:hypothetical protein
VLPDAADADTEFAWVDFRGRWGERQKGPFNGPTGPITKDQWNAPVDWHESLRSDSVIIPGGDETSESILSTFCGIVEAGSNQFRGFQQSPARTLVILGAIALGIRLLVKRTTWSRVPAVPLRQRRKTGQMLRGAVESYWTSRGAMAGIALAYLPAAALVGIIAAIDFGLGQAVAAFLTTVMLLLAAAIISAYWHLASTADAAPLLDAARLVRSRLRSLIVTIVLAIVIVVGLAVTIVGIPWSIRQLVRYQFNVPVVITEGLSGSEALRRSSELVRGRWWRTAFTVLLFSAIAALVSSTTQLLLLLVLSGLPLWAYVAVSFAALGVVVPLVATSPILLYGDAAARVASDEPTDAPAASAIPPAAADTLS